MLLNIKCQAGSTSTIRLKTTNHAPPLTLGRGKDATVQLDDTRCSRIHCSIRYWDDIFIIKDMNSSNGTFLNGNRIEVARLAPDDVVNIGDVEFKALANKAENDSTVLSSPPPSAVS